MSVIELVKVASCVGVDLAPSRKSDGVPNVDASWHIELEELEIEEIIGEGSYGTVFSGLYIGLPVAIKKLNVRKMGKDDMVKYLIREVGCSKHSHPNIVSFIGVAEDQEAGFVYLVSEKLECSLRAVLKAQDDPDYPLDWMRRISFAIDGSRALAFLHAKKIIHRDVKSKNFLVDENLKVKICDFGFARTAKKGVKRTMTICGTESWMAPEVILGEPYDNKADVFSFGIVLFELISRKKVKDCFSRSPRYLFTIDVERAREITPPGTPDAFLDLALSCCAGEPEERPTFNEILKELLCIQKSFASASSMDKKRRRNRSILSYAQSASTIANSPPIRRKRCDFSLLHKTNLKFDKESRMEEILENFFSVASRGSWVTIGYVDEETLGVCDNGMGGVEDWIDSLANDEVMFSLVRISCDLDTAPRDLFVYWAGNNVDPLQRGQKKLHIPAVQGFLRPYIAEFTILGQSEELTEEYLWKHSHHPLPTLIS